MALVVRLNIYDETSLIASLQAVVDALKSYRRAKDDILRVFPSFRRNRLKILQSLIETADILDGHELNCNIAKTVGACFGILGSAIALGGLITLSVVTFGVATPLAVAAAPAVIAGGVAAGAGGATSIGSNITKKIIEKTKVDEVNSSLEKDEEYGRYILKYIERSENVLKAIEKIMSYDVFDEIIKALQMNVNRYYDFQHYVRYNGLPQWMEDVINSLSISQNQKEKLRKLVTDITNSDNCIALLAKIVKLFCTLGPTLKKCYCVFNTVPGDFSLAKIAFGADNGAVFLARLMQPATKDSPAAGILSTVSLAIDLYTLITTAKNIHKGSKSEIAKKMKTVKDKLQQELNQVETIYNGLKT